MSDQFGTCNVRVGPVLIDVPRSIGYFGGVTAAVAIGLVDPPLAVFIAAVPFFTMLTHRSLPAPIRFVGETLEGAAKPVGGDDDGYLKLEDPQRERERAEAIADKIQHEGRVNHSPVSPNELDFGENDSPQHYKDGVAHRPSASP